MIRSEDMRRPVGTALQSEPGTNKICDMIRPEGLSRLEGTALQTKPSTAISRLDDEDDFFGRARRRFVRREPTFQAAHGLFSPSTGNGMCSVG
jgi:hypothetical protein